MQMECENMKISYDLLRSVFEYCGIYEIYFLNKFVECLLMGSRVHIFDFLRIALKNKDTKRFKKYAKMLKIKIPEGFRLTPPITMDVLNMIEECFQDSHKTSRKFLDSFDNNIADIIYHRDESIIKFYLLSNSYRTNRDMFRYSTYDLCNDGGCVNITECGEDKGILFNFHSTHVKLEIDKRYGYATFGEI
jgi:hypothetical protein